MASWGDNLLGKNSLKISKSGAFERLAKEILDEDKLLGEELLKGFMIWVQHTHSYNQIGKSDFEFGSLEEYLVYRSRDVGVEYVSWLDITCPLANYLSGSLSGWSNSATMPRYRSRRHTC
jgi:hypothetical protein